jgi:hypothetical protein
MKFCGNPFEKLVSICGMMKTCKALAYVARPANCSLDSQSQPLYCAVWCLIYSEYHFCEFYLGMFFLPCICQGHILVLQAEMSVHSLYAFFITANKFACVFMCICVQYIFFL